MENVLFKIDLDLTEIPIKKRDELFIKSEKPIDLILNYNETQSEAFKDFPMILNQLIVISKKN